MPLRHVPDTSAARNGGACFWIDGIEGWCLGLTLQRRPGHAVGTKILDVIDIQQSCKAKARSIHTALDRPNGATADIRGFLIGKSRGSNQKQGFALVGRELGQGAAKIFEVEVRALLGMDSQPAGIGPVRVFDFPTALAVFGMEKIAEDGEEPRIQVRAGFKSVQI
jgi:hypothetical protein